MGALFNNLCYNSKYETKSGKINTSRIEKVFDYIPLHVGEKIKYSNISNTDQSRDIREALECLIKARIVIPAYHSNCSGIPLKAGKNSKVYKCFFLDVGLTGHCAGITWNDLNSEKSGIPIKGNLGEQFVAQHLQYYKGGYDPPELYYWLREGKSKNAEVDFVIVKDSNIIPIEVKSGKTGTISVSRGRKTKCRRTYGLYSYFRQYQACSLFRKVRHSLACGRNSYSKGT